MFEVLHQVWPVKADYYSFMVKGKMIDHVDLDLILEDYDINNDTTVHVFCRMLGGQY